MEQTLDEILRLTFTSDVSPCARVHTNTELDVNTQVIRKSVSIDTIYDR